jgi:hypothetical protein
MTGSRTPDTPKAGKGRAWVGARLTVALTPGPRAPWGAAGW